MNKVTKWVVVLVAMFAFVFSTGTIEASAAVKKTAAKKVSSAKKTVSSKKAVSSKKSASVKKTASSKKSTSSTKKASTTKVKKTAAKKTTAKKATAKKTTAKKTTARKIVYSRGSGAAIASGSTSDVVSVAKRYLGARYVFGGSSPRGFDCSGFAKYVYSQIGVSLPRTASEQATKGLAIRNVSDLKAGDLVFFETYAPGISHVGIYIGDGKFIHASNPKGGVRVTSISGTSYASDFRGGTRILR